MEHRQPKDSPTQETKHRQQIDEAFGVAKFAALGLAAGFEDLVEDFDLPTQRLPF